MTAYEMIGLYAALFGIVGAHITIFIALPAAWSRGRRLTFASVVLFAPALALGGAAQSVPLTWWLDWERAPRTVVVSPLIRPSFSHPEFDSGVLTRFQSVAHARLEDVLLEHVDDDVQLLQRSDLDSVTEEWQFARHDSGALGQIGRDADLEEYLRAKGADLVLLPVVRSIEIEPDAVLKSYTAISMSRAVNVTITVRSVDVESWRVVGNRTITARAVDSASNVHSSATVESVRGRVKSADQLVIEAIENAMTRIGDDQELVDALLGRDTRVITSAGATSIRFAPVPSGAEVYIDGTYFGVSPIDVALPLNSRFAVQFLAAGHEPWQGEYVARPAIAIVPTLRAEGGGQP